MFGCTYLSSARMFVYILQLICSRPFILANIKTKNSSSNIQSDAISGASVCLKHTERHKCFAHKAKEDTNWADINRGLRVHWCRNLGTTDFISHIIWHFVSSYSFTAATATTANKDNNNKNENNKKIIWAVHFVEGVETTLCLSCVQIRNWQHKQFCRHNWKKLQQITRV